MRWSLLILYLILEFWTSPDSISCFTKDYSGYQHWLVRNVTTDTRNLLELAERRNDVIMEIHGNEAEVLIPPGMVTRMKRDLGLSAQQIYIRSTDFQVQLDETWDRLNSRSKRNASSTYDNNDFNGYEAIELELHRLVSQCSSRNLICSVFSIGKSQEGRNMTVFRLSSGNRGNPGVWLGSLLHAREWITGAVVMRTLRHLVLNYGTNQEATDLLNKFDFYFLPVSNPDGYVYTWTSDRMWRKNRRPNYDDNGNVTCYGVDLNRNFDYKWGYHLLEPDDAYDFCSLNYIGPSAASEPETKAIQEAANSLRSVIQVWISYHGSRSYNVILTPYSWSCDVEPRDYDAMLRAGSAGINAILKQFNGIEEGTDAYWRTGTACNVFYPAKGTTLDYVYAVAHIKYAFTPELRGPTFDPPPSAIEYNFRENWIGITHLLNEVSKMEEEELLREIEVIRSISSPLGTLISYLCILVIYVCVCVWICCYKRAMSTVEL